MISSNELLIFRSVASDEFNDTDYHWTWQLNHSSWPVDNDFTGVRNKHDLKCTPNVFSPLCDLLWDGTDELWHKQWLAATEKPVWLNDLALFGCLCLSGHGSLHYNSKWLINGPGTGDTSNSRSIYTHTAAGLRLDSTKAALLLLLLSLTPSTPRPPHVLFMGLRSTV